jgi:hypothetical protein
VKKLFLLAVLLDVVLSADSHAVVFPPILSPLSGFGGGDGWLAPGDRPYLTTNDAQAGLAFNPVTGHLLLINRAGGLSIPILDSATGADVASLNANIQPYNWGIQPLQKISVTRNGTIYSTNIADGSLSQFRIYQWDNESSAPFLGYQSNSSEPVRQGDSMATTIVQGVDWLVVSAAPGIAGGTYNGYNLYSTSGGAPFSIIPVQFPSNPPAPGDHRLGLTFMGSNRVLGTSGGGAARLSELTYDGNFGLLSATFTGSPALQSLSERPMDFAVIGGKPLLATADTSTSLVRLYDMTNPLSPLLLDSATTISGASNANSSGVGAVCFGSVVGNTAQLYAMNANNGIQAFNVNVPEPAGVSLIALAGLALQRRRR